MSDVIVYTQFLTSQLRLMNTFIRQKTDREIKTQHKCKITQQKKKHSNWKINRFFIGYPAIRNTYIRLQLPIFVCMSDIYSVNKRQNIVA